MACCFVVTFVVAIMFAWATVLLLKATTHVSCVVIDLYALDEEGVFIEAGAYPLDGFEIFAVFELPRDYKMKPLTVRLLRGFGNPDLKYKMGMLFPAYKVGSAHTCMLRTYPSPKVMLERPDGGAASGYDTLVIATAAASGGFMACACLLAAMMYFNVNAEDRMKEAARSARNLLYGYVSVYWS